MGFPGGARGKEPACQCRRHKRCGFDPWIGKIPWRRAWQPTPVFLPGESHGQRSLEGYSPWGHRVRHDWATKRALTSEHTENHLCSVWSSGTKGSAVTQVWVQILPALLPGSVTSVDSLSLSGPQFPLSNADEGSSHLIGLSRYLAWVRDSEHMSRFSAVKWDF